MIPGNSVIAAVPVAGLPDDAGTVTSTAVLQLPVDYYMENLPQYRATGRTYEKIKGKAGEDVKLIAGPRGRISGVAPSFRTTSNDRGYD